MKDYYNQRAPEYDEWFYRKGKYDRGRDPNAQWFSEVQTVFDALDSFEFKGDILEIASGTGIWTERLVKNASMVTCLDSSEEMILRSKTRIKNSKVKYVIVDFYHWIPGKVYDGVAFSFWMSHVPSSKLDEFASRVSSCLKPKGKMFLVDQQRGSMSTTDDPTLSPTRAEIVTRELNDGREFKIIKHYYSPSEIEACFMKKGIVLKVSLTPSHFYYGLGEKRTM